MLALSLPCPGVRATFSRRDFCVADTGKESHVIDEPPTPGKAFVQPLFKSCLFCDTMRHRHQSMTEQQSNDPLHGLTLETILTRLVESYGWPELGRLIDIKCFNIDPSVSSSLKFLRKTPWARTKVENLYIRYQRRAPRRHRRKTP